MSKIKRIDSGRPMDGSFWEVGQPISRLFSGDSIYSSDARVVTEIKDMTAESESGQVHSQYDIFVDGKLNISLVNVPVLVYYE